MYGEYSGSTLSCASASQGASAYASGENVVPSERYSQGLGINNVDESDEEEYDYDFSIYNFIDRQQRYLNGEPQIT